MDDDFMRKIYAIVLTFLFIFALTACNKKSSNKNASIETSEKSAKTVTNSEPKSDNNSEEKKDGDKAGETSVKNTTQTENEVVSSQNPSADESKPGNSEYDSKKKAFKYSRIPMADKPSIYATFQHNDVIYGMCYGAVDGKAVNALIKTDENNNYIECIGILSEGETVHKTAGYYNNRFYFAKQAAPDPYSKEVQQCSIIEIYSFDTNGKDYKKENEIRMDFSYIENMSTCDENGNWFVWIGDRSQNYNLYKYNINSKQLIKLSPTGGDNHESDDAIFAMNGRLYRFDYDAAYSYDYDYGDKKLFCKYPDSFLGGGYFFYKMSDSFYINVSHYKSDKSSLYSIDFSGNYKKLR